MDRAEGDTEWWNHVPPETLQVALTLAQTQWWVDSEATPHLVDAMSAEHLLAVIDFLVLRTRELRVAVQETQVRSLPGSAPGRAAARLLAGGDRLDADEWLESTPLMGRLRLLARKPRQR